MALGVDIVFAFVISAHAEPFACIVRHYSARYSLQIMFATYPPHTTIAVPDTSLTVFC